MAHKSKLTREQRRTRAWLVQRHRAIGKAARMWAKVTGMSIDEAREFVVDARRKMGKL